MALVHAARTFDPTKGTFSPHYMRWAISILNADAGKKLIVVPRRFRKEFVFTRVGLKNLAINVDAFSSDKELKDIPFFVLTKRQYEAMTETYANRKTESQIADVWGTTRNNVHTVLVNAVKRLRTEARRGKPDDKPTGR